MESFSLKIHTAPKASDNPSRRATLGRIVHRSQLGLFIFLLQVKTSPSTEVIHVHTRGVQHVGGGGELETGELKRESVTIFAHAHCLGGIVRGGGGGGGSGP